MSISMLDCKTNLARYLDQAENGEIIVICRHNRPVAELRGIAPPPERPVRTAGVLAGQIAWKAGTFAPMTDAEAADFLGE